MEETKKVTLLGSLIDFAKSFGGHSEGNERNTLFASREKILKQYGDKRLLVETMAEKEFERISKDKTPTSIRARIKTSGSANGGNGKDRPTVEMREQTIEEEIDRGEK